MVATLKESIAPSNLSLVSFSSTGAKLMWHAPLAKEMIQEYDIYNGTELVEIVPSSITTYTVSEYLPNTEYHFTVKAKDSEGNVSSASNTVTAIFDTQAPTVPSNLKVSGVTATSVNLTWTASIDNVGVTGYEIYKGTTLVGTSASNNYTVTGLNANTSYTFTVKAKDAEGNVSGASNVITVTTLPLFIPSIPIHYVYDSYGRIDYIQISSGRILDYQYDSSGNLIGVIVE
ncbi:fibronectin type III domain-containing protein [Paenibacillus sepulcri]|uniref:Fibronectin type III domain-containing protein n=2 Tax=Paenibacillus sepulcri TaxID=359917 RepID=A0ABS7BXW9_9BACL|nr:fibronectin type III domain-containing protein [Paenibacillus sepulcri]